MLGPSLRMKKNESTPSHGDGAREETVLVNVDISS